MSTKLVILTKNIQDKMIYIPPSWMNFQIKVIVLEYLDQCIQVLFQFVNIKSILFVPELLLNTQSVPPLNDFQKLNLSMSRKSARVVDKSIPRFKYLLGALKSYLKHAYHFRGLFCAFKQLAIEIPFPWTKTGEEFYSLISLFDTYMSF